MANYKHFTRQEVDDASFGCDDGFDRMNPMAMHMFDLLREACGFPLHGTCFFRTVLHDKAKGRSGRSKHTEGIAADFACTDSNKRYIIVREAIRLGFKGIGIHKDFVHVDIREVDEPVIWLY